MHYAVSDVEVCTCRGDPVAVVGGGNSTGQTALHLAAQSPAMTLPGGWISIGTASCSQRRRRPGGNALSDVDGSPAVLETSRTGVFAVGDVRSGSIKGTAAAVGEGSMAVRLVHEHLGGRRAQAKRLVEVTPPPFLARLERTWLRCGSSGARVTAGRRGLAAAWSR